MRRLELESVGKFKPEFGNLPGTYGRASFQSYLLYRMEKKSWIATSNALRNSPEATDGARSGPLRWVLC